MIFLGMLLSAVLGFIIGMLCKTIIDTKTINYMRKQLNEAKEESKVEVIEIKDKRTTVTNPVNYFEPF